MEDQNFIELDGDCLDTKKFEDVVFHKKLVKISPNAIAKVEKSRQSLEKLIQTGKPIYGVNTGFGSLLNRKIKPEESKELQINLIRSHSAGFGKPLSVEKVRAIMLVRANSLCRGHSGCTVELIQRDIDFLNNDVYSFVPEFGSVGSSGDLAPLSHLFLSMMGEGEIIVDGQRVPSIDVLNKLGIKPYELREKEALAFINGTAAITGIGMVELVHARENIALATGSASVAMDAMGATKKAFTPWVLQARNQRGQEKIGSVLYSNLQNSKSIEKGDSEKVQDAYTIRCTPQVYGAVLDTINYVESVLVNEMNSTTDNPLINDDEYISAGNFHGEPVALVCDFLAIALVDLGNMIERRIARITDENLSGLDAFLVKNSGLNSGYMIAQYTAAALCNRNKILVYPGSADSIPTCANQEDHVSMGANAANKLTEINENINRIIATEYVLSVQGMDLKNTGYSAFSEMVRRETRKEIEILEKDRPVYRDMDKMQIIMNEFESEIENKLFC
jgi:histidine ammonia-lyase